MFTNIPAYTKIFIDSNIFIYHFLGNDIHSEASTNFINSVEVEVLQGYTSSIILSEVLHRLMIVEAIEKFGTDIEDAVKFLKRHPIEIRKLTKCFDAIERIEHLNIVIFPVTGIDVIKVRSISKEYGLLTNDSINMVLMQTYSITNIATNDSDFDNIKHIHVFKP